jgi:hypothetical protein
VRKAALFDPTLKVTVAEVPEFDAADDCDIHEESDEM